MSRLRFCLACDLGRRLFEQPAREVEPLAVCINSLPARIIHERFVAKLRSRKARRARGVVREEGILEQDVDRQSGELARRQASRSCESAIAAEALMNDAG